MKNVVIINGRQYDALSGQPLAEADKAQRASAKAPQNRFRVMQDVIAPVKVKRPVKAAAPSKPTVEQRSVKQAARSVHKTTDRSHTLNRVATKRPVPATRSAMIRHFVPHHKPVISPAAKTQPEPVRHLSTAPKRANQSAKTIQPTTELTPKQIKEQLIKNELAKVETSKAALHHKPRGLKHLLGQRRGLTVSAACLAILLLSGYFAYLNMPNLSVRVAANRVGVSASYPEYQPDGYRFIGPVAYSPGEVRLNFESNTSNQGYEIKQRSSNWDSHAVLDNYVVPKSETYLTYQEQGLTIYTFDSQAAWVNGGVLYTINGDAPLSSEQVLKIATSL